MTKIDTVTANTILHVTVGSQLTGTNLPGTSDNDEVSIFVENKESVYGMARSLDHLSVRTQPEGVRSGSEDTDRMAYSLRKYLYLAAQGNPSILLPLFAPEDMIIATNDIGNALRDMKNSFVSQEAGKRFLGYAHAQHKRMMGEGRQSRVPKRPELEAQYGYDTKYASHAVRLSLQGLDLLREGKLNLPMVQEDIRLLMDIRTGKYTKAEVSELVLELLGAMKYILESGQTSVPQEADRSAISEFSIWAHETFWSRQK